MWRMLASALLRATGIATRPSGRYLPAVVAAGILVPCFAATIAMAQAPRVAIYFDGYYRDRSEVCQGPGGYDTLFVFAEDFDAWITAIEFSVDFSDIDGFIWIADLLVTPLVIGTTPEGIAMTWSTPQSGFTPLLLMEILVAWTCEDCRLINQHLFVRPHPLTGHLRAVRYPDRTFIDAIGDDGWLCYAGPTETTTWGAVKALYVQ